MTSATKLQDETANVTSAFPIPVTRQQMQADVLCIYVHQMRILAWLSVQEEAWKITGLPQADNSLIFAPDLSDEELGFSYERIAKTAFAQSMETLYDYGCLGVLNESQEEMVSDGIYSWISAVLCDMHQSAFLCEYDEYGGAGLESAGRLLRLAELANARRTLEGHEPFYAFWSKGRDNDAAGYDALSVRQMALLSGMEEMSIRAAANPKRANPLATFKDEKDRTRVTPDVARVWLKSKGRYVPIVRKWSAGEIELTKKCFNWTGDLALALEARVLMLGHDGTIRAALLKRLAAAGVKASTNPIKELILDLPPESFCNEALMRAVAETLDLPADLLVLRAKEAYLLESLAEINSQVLEIAQH